MQNRHEHGRLRASDSEAADARAAPVADHATVMVWTSDPGGECTFVSPSWYEFTGLDEGAGLGRGWIEAINPSDRSGWQKHVEVAHRTHEPFQMEYRLRHRDGGYRWVMDTAEPHFDEHGTFQGLIGSVVDISDWKDMEDELQGLVAELERSNAAKSEMLGFISHEFRTPVTIIAGNLDRLARRFDSLGRAGIETSLTEARANVERLRRLVQNMLVLARREPAAEVELEPTLVQRIVQSVVQVEQKRDPSRPIEARVAEDLPPVMAADGYLEQILENLLANSRGYGAPGTPITVEARRDRGDVAVTVADRGTELTPEQVAQFFEPFFRSERHKALSGGAGLGLAVCGRLVDVLNGTIEAQPRPGGGLMVTVRLPALAVEGD